MPKFRSDFVSGVPPVLSRPCIRIVRSTHVTSRMARSPSPKIIRPFGVMQGRPRIFLDPISCFEIEKVYSTTGKTGLKPDRNWIGIVTTFAGLIPLHAADASSFVLFFYPSWRAWGTASTRVWTFWAQSWILLGGQLDNRKEYALLQLKGEIQLSNTKWTSIAGVYISWTQADVTCIVEIRYLCYVLTW